MSTDIYSVSNSESKTTPQSKTNEETLGWLAAILALAGQVAMIFKSPLAFILWTLGEGLMLSFAIKRKKYGEVTFFSLYIITNCVALLVWIY
jgi:hypothetical protein